MSHYDADFELVAEITGQAHPDPARTDGSTVLTPLSAVAAAAMIALAAS